MADTVLELMTRVDIGPLKSAMTEAAASVSSSTQKMKADIASFSSSSMAANQGVEATMAGLPKEFIKVEAGGVFAFEQIKRRVIEATSEVGALRQEILGTNDAAKLDQLNAQLDQARARMTAARTEMRAMRMETTETREKADLLGDSLGVKIPGALGRLGGQIPAVQGLMNALFAPTLVLFLAEAIDRVVSKIADMSREMGGFGEVQRKAYESALEYNSRMILSSLELKEKQLAISVIGKEGAAKYAAEARNAANADLERAAATDRARRSIEAQEKEVERLSSLMKWRLFKEGEEVKITVHGIETYNLKEELGKAEATLNRMKETWNELDAKQREGKVTTGERGAEESARQGEEARAVQRANVDANKNLQNEYITFYEQGLRRMYAAEKITLEDEVTGERAAIQARLENERAAAAQRKAILAAEHQATGKDTGKDVAGINEQLAAVELRTRSELAAIGQRFDVEKLQQLNAVNLATVQAAKTTADAEINVIEETSRRRFEDGKILVSELTAIEKAAANQRIDEQRSVVQEQISAANEYPEKNKALIIKLNSDLENLERERITKLDAIDREAENRADQVRAIEAEAEKAHQQSLLEIARLGIQTRATLGLISGRERVSQLQAITSQEYNLEREAIEKKRALYAQGTTQYEQAEKELQAITDRYSKQMAEDESKALLTRFAQWQKFDRQISDGFANAVGEMIRGQKTFGQALAQVWTGMVVDFAQMLTKWLVQWTLQHTAMRVVSNLFHLQELTQQTVSRTAQTAGDTAAQTAQVARHVTANTAMAASDAAYTTAYLGAVTVRVAGEVAARTVEGAKTAATDVGEVISLAAVGAAGAAAAAAPGGPGAMAAAAVAAEAIILAFAPQAAVFALHGAVLDKDSLVQAHAKEMILPPHISVGLQGLIASGGLSDIRGSMAALHGSPSSSSTDNSSRSNSSGGSTYKTMHNHIRIEIHNHGDAKMSQDELIAGVKRGVKSGHLKFGD